jgi:aquaporin Z
MLPPPETGAPPATSKRVVKALESRAPAAIPAPRPKPLAAAWRTHRTEYMIEGALLGAFMISACFFCVVLEHPSSPVRGALPDAFLRRGLMGLAMGGTAVAIIYSRWGKRSGAHINPATTLTFLRLGKVAREDALFYALFQCAGAIAGVLLAALVLSGAVRHPSVNFAATVPGERGAAVAFLAEAAIAFVLMTVVLAVSNAPRWNRFTGLAAGTCVALFIAFEAPLSGMSMNPARSLGSAVSAMTWESLWIYVAAPPIGMLLAAEARIRLLRRRPVLCAKLHHENLERCIFRCAYPVCGPAAARRSP